MPSFSAALLALFLVLFGAQAQETTSFYYLDPATVPLANLLGNPPGKQTAATRDEIDQLLQLQQSRTAAEIARAQTEVDLDPFIFASVLGPRFTPQNFPKTEALLKKVQSDAHNISEEAKTVWNRPRPPLQDSRIHPAVSVPNSSSYPSGHATLGTCWALILAELDPDARPQLLARSGMIGYDRMMAGVHFPSDVEAGQKLGTYLAERFLQSPAFQADLKKARAEFQTPLP